MSFQIPTEIREAIKKDRLIIFAGSGLSRRFNRHSWMQLVKDILNEINDLKLKAFIPLIDNGLMTPIEVLDKLKNEHNKIHKYIENNFKIDNSSILQTHKKIIALSSKIITTNYDTAFEEADNTVYTT